MARKLESKWKVFNKTEKFLKKHKLFATCTTFIVIFLQSWLQKCQIQLNCWKKRSKKFFLLQTQNPFIPWLPNLDIKRHLLASQPGYNLLLSLSLLFSPLLSFFSSLLSSTLVSNNNNRKKGYALHPLDIINDAIMFTCFTLQSLSRSASTWLHYRLWSLSLIISFYFRFLFVCNLPSLLPLYCCSKYFILTRFDD